MLCGRAIEIAIRAGVETTFAAIYTEVSALLL